MEDPHQDPSPADQENELTDPNGGPIALSQDRWSILSCEAEFLFVGDLPAARLIEGSYDDKPVQLDGGMRTGIQI